MTSIQLNVLGRHVVIIGGGVLSVRKGWKFAEAGARISVIAPEIDGRWQQISNVQLYKKRLQPTDDVPAAFVILFTATDWALSQAIYERYGSYTTIINAVFPEHGNANGMQTCTHKDITVAVSTSGISPTLAKHIQRDVEPIIRQYSPEFQQFLSTLRQTVKKSNADERQRKQWLQEGVALSNATADEWSAYVKKIRNHEIG
ncbi:MAG: precorrin-2 dehydrogenase/sirohydrochlorin ferrochelatase family protein [Bacilli bacterium]